MEDRLDFLQFVKRTTMDLEISYSLWAGLLHSYLVYQSFSRISYCPSPMELHNVPAIPKFFATLAPTWVCTTRPRTFVDLVSWIQFFFYSGTLGSRLIDASGLEKSMYIHGPYIVSGGLWSAFWYVEKSLIE